MKVRSKVKMEAGFVVCDAVMIMIMITKILKWKYFPAGLDLRLG